MLKVIIPFYLDFETCKPGLRALQGAGVKFDFAPIQGALIYASRNHGVTGGSTLIRQDPVGNYSHYLFIDSDIGFKADDVKSALAFNHEIHAHPYLRHASDGLYQCGELSHLRRGYIDMRYASYESGVKRISFCGGGFLLVRRDVFRRMRYPYFRHELFEENGQAEMTGEDIGFCLQARDAGIPIHCNFDRPVFHRPRRPEDFNVRF